MCACMCVREGGKITKQIRVSKELVSALANKSKKGSASADINVMNVFRWVRAIPTLNPKP